MNTTRDILEALTKTIDELANRTGFPKEYVSRVVKRYVYELIKESLTLKRDIMALLEIERFLNREFDRVEFNGCYLLISRDEEVIVKVIDGFIPYDEYARQYMKELVKLLHMKSEGKKVYLFFWNDNKGEYKILELNEYLNKLSSFLLNRIIELSERKIVRGRRPTKIPLEIVQSKLKESWTFKRIYHFLVERGYLRYKERGEEKVLTYKQFCYRLNKIDLRRIMRNEANKLTQILYKEEIMKAYEEFKRVTDKRDWGNIDLFMSFLERKDLILRDSIARDLVYKKLMVILRESIL